MAPSRPEVRVGVSGHRGLPPETVELVRGALRERLAEIPSDHLVGITSLADGADQLFAEAVLERGGRLEVIVPALGYREGLPKEARPDYDRLIARAATVETLPFPESTSESHMEAGRLMISRSDRLLAVWDGQPARGYGGTADIVAAAQDLEVPVEVVWPVGARRD